MQRGQTFATVYVNSRKPNNGNAPPQHRTQSLLLTTSAGASCYVLGGRMTRLGHGVVNDNDSHRHNNTAHPLPQ